MSGSDPAILADIAAYELALQSAETEEERRDLQRDFLLAHGGQVRIVNGQRELVGGLYPAVINSG